MPSQIHKILAASAVAFKRNRRPGLMLQALALMIVLGYYLIPSFKNLLATVAAWKESGGYLFSAAVTAFFAGFVPFFLQKLIEKERLTSRDIKMGIYITLFWAYRGAEVDLFYRYQALWFGDDLSALVILKKTIVDQLIYAPFWSIPVVTLGILFKDCRLSVREFRRQLDSTFFRLTFPTIVISTWMIWIPSVALIYALPLLLQVPMMNLVACFYAVLVMYLTRHRKEMSG